MPVDPLEFATRLPTAVYAFVAVITAAAVARFVLRLAFDKDTCRFLAGLTLLIGLPTCGWLFLGFKAAAGLVTGLFVIAAIRGVSDDQFRWSDPTAWIAGMGDVFRRGRRPLHRGGWHEDDFPED
ncbi:MAG: hypothetical protein AAF532_12515 [Planctomycetota bacterium]